MNKKFQKRWATPIIALFLGSVTVHAQNVPADPANGLQWRLIGPLRGGWSTVAEGIPEEPDTFYFGAAGGGVWKTTDAGQTWHSVFDAVPASNIGALAIGGNEGNVLYAGTGQVTSRYDIAAGDGVYKSTDAGATWQHVGLEATRHIGAIKVDPRDSSKVLVAALGHAFGPNPERGIFRSVDGGKTWGKTLFIDNETGAVDLTSDPANPDTVFAAVWKTRFWPWLSYFMSDESAASGVYKSVDGGATWKRVQGGGWPTARLGRIGLAASDAGGRPRVYAIVESDEAGGLYRSDDGGGHWQHVNKDKALANSYFAMLTVAPDDPDTVYVMNRSVTRCDHGGSHCVIFKGAPGGDDYHQMWINPRHPDHMIVASDQGTAITVNSGRTWSDWYNQPTGQFYHLAADNRFPYWVYSGQQDSGTAGVSTRSDYGALGLRDWHPVGGDERDYDIPDAQDPDIVYGSGLGGRLSRWDARTGEVQNVSPWSVSSYGLRPTDFKYRYTWITPIAQSQLAPFPLYQGAQVLFRSLDRGQSWQTISPDLSAKSASGPHCEGDLAPPAARACGYGVIYSIALSPRDNDEIWIGTDDGLIRLTRDAGAHWQNVTPRGVAPWAKVATLDVSATTPGSAYAAIDNHRQDDFRPQVLRTRDFGKSWSDITSDLPANHFVDVVRADPVKSGLLYAGTDSGVFVSLDDGGHWRSLQRNLPTAWVRDLLVHGDDLIAATQGRAIWVLDDLSPLRQAQLLESHSNQAILFQPAPAVRLRGSQNKDTPPPADTALAQNPPVGAAIDYWLPANAGKVLIEIRDANGQLVTRASSDETPREPNSERYFTRSWLQPPQRLSSAQGAHRYLWNMRYPRPLAVHHDYSIGAVFGVGTPITPEGMLVPPGVYQVLLSVDGIESHGQLKVVPDPRVALQDSAVRDALSFSRAIEKALYRDFVAYGELQAVDKAVAEAKKNPTGSKGEPSLTPAAADFDKATKPLRSGKGDESSSLDAIGEVLSGLQTDIEGSDRSPTRQQVDLLAATNARLDKAEALWTRVKSTQLATLNAQLRNIGRGEIVVPGADQIHLDEPPASKEIP